MTLVYIVWFFICIKNYLPSTTHIYNNLQIRSHTYSSSGGIFVSNKRLEIIKILKDSEGKAVSGEELGNRLGISRTMIWKYIRSLAKDGYEIESSPKIGYTLKSAPDRLYPDTIRMGLRSSLIGQQIHYFDELTSTNITAKELAHDADDGTIVVAEVQKGGRGRLGREWLSPRGGIWMSVILKPTISLAHASRLTLVAGVAISKAMRKLGVDARIKWPNDILINGKKVCGILTEVNAEMEQVDYIVVGIGINANVDMDEFSDDVRGIATTLLSELGEPIDRVSFIQDVLFELEQEYIRFRTQPFSGILDEWTSLSNTIGRQVTVTTPSKMIEGKAVGMTEDGALVVEDADGKRENVMAGLCIYTRAK